MGYKVIWDNGRNSAIYVTLESALSRIKFLIEDYKYTEVKLEVIEDKSD